MGSYLSIGGYEITSKAGSNAALRMIKDAVKGDDGAEKQALDDRCFALLPEELAFAVYKSSGTNLDGDDAYAMLALTRALACMVMDGDGECEPVVCKWS